MKNNKGFSLVELIIVIAIMAVLVGVMAPQYIKYVEKSRISTDEDNAAEFLGVVKTALSDEEAIADLDSSTNGAVYWKGGDFSADDDLEDLLDVALDTLGYEECAIKSTKYKSSTYVVSVWYNGSQSGFYCAGHWE